MSKTENSLSVLKELIDQTVSRVSLEPGSIRILFDDSELMIEGEWRLRSSEGDVMDRKTPLDVRRQFDLWRLCCKKVTEVHLVEEPEPMLIVFFEGGPSLEALIDEDGLEDWILTSPRDFIVSNGKEYLFGP